nr:hypothetical protein [Chlamydiota bacterium]
MTDKKETPRDFRRKIKRAEESRDLWKDKHQIVQYELEIPVSAKTANNCISFWKSAKESSVRRKYNYYFNNCSTAVYA